MKKDPYEASNKRKQKEYMKFLKSKDIADSHCEGDKIVFKMKDGQIFKVSGPLTYMEYLT